jgi:hypothetical protein
MKRSLKADQAAGVDDKKKALFAGATSPKMTKDVSLIFTEPLCD